MTINPALAGFSFGGVMDFLTLDKIKTQLRIELDDDNEDTVLSIYGEAAERAAINYLNRNLYRIQVPDTDPDGLVVSQDMILAMLMTCSHWYENRSPVTEFEQSAVPMTYQFLLSPYRIIPI